MPDYVSMLRVFKAELADSIVRSRNFCDIASLEREIESLISTSRLTWTAAIKSDSKVKESEEFLLNKAHITAQVAVLFRIKAELNKVQQDVMLTWRWYLGYRDSVVEQGISKEVFDARAKILFGCYLEVGGMIAAIDELMCSLNGEVSRLEHLGESTELEPAVDWTLAGGGDGADADEATAAAVAVKV